MFVHRGGPLSVRYQGYGTGHFHGSMRFQSNGHSDAVEKWRQRHAYRPRPAMGPETALQECGFAARVPLHRLDRDQAGSLLRSGAPMPLFRLFWSVSACALSRRSLRRVVTLVVTLTPKRRPEAAHLALQGLCRRRDSNPRHADYDRAAHIRECVLLRVYPKPAFPASGSGRDCVLYPWLPLTPC